MKIIHKIDDFLFTIFPKLKMGGGNTLIINELETYYTFGPFRPKISIDNEWITIEIDTNTIFSQEEDYNKTVALCEKGKYAEAKPILKGLIKKNPTNSEYHRIMGQILSDEGDQEEATNCLIDSLRWNSKNGWALLMMGNIFAKFKNDVPTAMKYYDQALIANPENNIAIHNIGANLMQQKKFEEAKKYFWKALNINDQYPNTHFALGMIAEMENDLSSAFYSTIQAIKMNKSKDGLYNNSVQQALEIAERIVKSGKGEKIVKTYLHKLEFDGNKEIELIESENIPTAATFEFAENHNRENHIIKYKLNHSSVDHLIMHELVHLDFALQAKKENLNQLFITTQDHKREFIKRIESTLKKLNKEGISEQAIANYCTSLFDGINRQTYNTPIDLFIEDSIYNEFPELRPYQFLSLYSLIFEALEVVTDKRIVDLSPEDVLSKSKIYNMVNAMQFRELYGVDFINDFRATQNELKFVNEFYDEYLQYRDDKEPAEEYELILHWAEDLKLDKNFELVDENEYRNKRTNIDNLLNSIEEDPYDLDSKDLYKKRDMEKFQESQKSMGTNMAVVMFMVSALQYFEGMAKEKIKQIAVEIAMQGTQGYRPDKEDYRISLIPGKEFSGYHILAYYYVSWALAIPEMLSQLQLPYDDEYKLALTMHKSNK